LDINVYCDAMVMFNRKSNFTIVIRFFDMIGYTFTATFGTI